MRTTTSQVVHLTDRSHLTLVDSSARPPRNRRQETILQITIRFLKFGLPVLIILLCLANRLFHSSKVSDFEQNWIHSNVVRMMPSSVEPIIEKKMRTSRLLLEREF